MFFSHSSKRKRDWPISKGDFENDGSFSFKFEEKISKITFFLVYVIEFRRDSTM